MSTTIEETYCDTCGTDLEEGQVGLCEDCRPRPFSELSDKAKQHAREEYTSGDYPGYDWWDNVYEDAERMAKIIGIEIGERTYGTCSGKVGHEPSIFFSGFYSQGDGACFEGEYRFNPGCVREISTETNDEELIRIATELYTLQMARRLLGLEYFSATISQSGNYSHSGTMSVDLQMEEDVIETACYDDLEDEVLILMRGFADWVYKSLETENDWLYSDAYVDEELNQRDMVFDANGDLQS